MVAKACQGSSPTGTRPHDLPCAEVDQRELAAAAEGRQRAPAVGQNGEIGDTAEVGVGGGELDLACDGAGGHVDLGDPVGVEIADIEPAAVGREG